jgi:hypothetical protein
VYVDGSERLKKCAELKHASYSPQLHQRWNTDTMMMMIMMTAMITMFLHTGGGLMRMSVPSLCLIRSILYRQARGIDGM